MKKVSAVALSATCLILVSVFLLSTKTNGNKKFADPVYKAALQGSSMPLPLYGFNGNNTHGPSFTNKAFRDTAASLDIKIIRYPGGTRGDYWDWRKGWFINDGERGVALMEEFKKVPYIPSGLKELKLLVDESHCDVVFNLNMVTRDVDDQVEMLKSAQSLGIPVKWVELGNEYNNYGSIGRKRFNSPKEYGNLCHRWITAIKESFPEAQVAVISGNRGYNADVKNWNSEVLDEASDADAIIVHIYPLPSEVIDNDGIDFEKLFDAYKEDYDRQEVDNIKKNVWVTEYNIQWGATKGIEPSDVDKVRQFSQTWGQALATIMMTSLSTTLPHRTPQMVVNTSLANWWGFAAIATEKNSLEKLPNGIAFEAWCKACTGKNELRQIDFRDQRNKLAKEYEVIGWEFTAGKEHASDLITNMTGKPIKIDISTLDNAGKSVYHLEFAEKDKVVQRYGDINHQTKPIVNNTIELPPYSIARL